MELRRIARDQLQKYDTVEFCHAEAADAAHVGSGFAITMHDGARLTCRKLLLATGVVDHIPQVEGSQSYMAEAFCPYCDGWELRDQPIGIYGRGEHGKGLALELTAWSKDLVLLTDGNVELDGKDVDRLRRNQILVRTEKIAVLEGDDGILRCIQFESGEALERRAIFLSCGESQASDLPARLGCKFTSKGAVDTGTYETTNVPGLYVAGDAGRYVQLSIVAAAEGAEAAFAINTALLKEDVL
jgi:thioredoxin reductase